MEHKDLINRITYHPEEGYFTYNHSGKILRNTVDPNFGHTIFHVMTGNPERRSFHITGHNLAYYWMIGEKPPKHYIKCKDGDKTNLKWENIIIRELKPKKTCTGSKQGEKVYTEEMLRELLDYDKSTGKFYWKRRKVADRFDKIFNTQFAGLEAGSTWKGYVKIRVKDTYDFWAHRIAWLFSTGNWPQGDNQIDHINQIRDDNRPENLREVENSVNGKNQGRRLENKSGYTGVRKTRFGKWNARIMVDGKGIHLGNYETVEEAAEVRRLANIKYEFHENHGEKDVKKYL